MKISVCDMMVFLQALRDQLVKEDAAGLYCCQECKTVGKLGDEFLAGSVNVPHTTCNVCMSEDSVKKIERDKYQVLNVISRFVAKYEPEGGRHFFLAVTIRKRKGVKDDTLVLPNYH